MRGIIAARKPPVQSVPAVPRRPKLKMSVNAWELQALQGLIKAPPRVYEHLRLTAEYTASVARAVFSQLKRAA